MGKLRVLFKNESEDVLLGILAKHFGFHAKDVHKAGPCDSRNYYPFALLAGDSEIEKLKAPKNTAKLNRSGIEILTSFDRRYHCEVTLRNLPRALEGRSDGDLRKALEDELQHAVRECRTYTQRSGRKALFFITETETQAAAIGRRKYIDLFYLRIEMAAHLCLNKGQPLLQCKRCFRLGHHLRKCKGSPVCMKCGRTRHEGGCSQPKYCVICKLEGHTAAAYSCPSRKRAQASLRSSSVKRVKRTPSTDSDGFQMQGRRKLPKTNQQSGAAAADSRAAAVPAVSNPPAKKGLSKNARRRRRKKAKLQENKNKNNAKAGESVKSQPSTAEVSGDGAAKASKVKAKPKPKAKAVKPNIVSAVSDNVGPDLELEGFSKVHYIHAAALEYSRMHNITFQSALDEYMKANGLSAIRHPSPPKKVANMRSDRDKGEVIEKPKAQRRVSFKSVPKVTPPQSPVRSQRKRCASTYIEPVQAKRQAQVDSEEAAVASESPATISQPPANQIEAVGTEWDISIPDATEFRPIRSSSPEPGSSQPPANQQQAVEMGLGNSRCRSPSHGSNSSLCDVTATTLENTVFEEAGGMVASPKRIQTQPGKVLVKQLSEQVQSPSSEEKQVTSYSAALNGVGHDARGFTGPMYEVVFSTPRLQGSEPYRAISRSPAHAVQVVRGELCRQHAKTLIISGDLVNRYGHRGWSDFVASLKSGESKVRELRPYKWKLTQ